jgi:hypothetical protein
VDAIARVHGDADGNARFVLPKLTGAVSPDRARNATIAFRRSDRRDASRLDDPYGDDGMARPV